MKVCEIFKSHQFEGSNTGKLTTFIRLSGCNLNCKFCDTKYAATSFKELSLEEIGKKITTSFVTITGGEPLSHRENFVKLVKYLLDDLFVQIEVETNGTIEIPKALSLEKENIQWNVSPKLSFSGNSFSKRINFKALEKFANLPNSIFKIVVRNQKDINEAQDILLKRNLEIDIDKIYLMPEGKTREEQLNNGKKIWELAKNYNFNFSPRIHILLFDNKRGV